MEKVKVYKDPKEFWIEVSPFLKKEEAKNSLCLGLSYTFQTNSSECMYQSACFSEGQLLGSLVVSRYRTSHNFLPSPVFDQRVARKLFDEFQRTNCLATGIVGEKMTANIYKNFFEECGHRTKINMVQGLYRCETVKIPHFEDDIKFRVAEDRDIQKLGQWIEEFHEEAVPHDPPVVGVELAKAKIENKMIYVLEKRDSLISMAAWSRDIETSCSVNLVFTPKSQRKRGYASLATAKLTQHLLNSGKKETNLYTDMTNPTSNKIYIDIGYELVCDSVHFGIVP